MLFLLMTMQECYRDLTINCFYRKYWLPLYVIRLKRETIRKTYHHYKMGSLTVPVISIYKTIFGIKYSKVYEYRETYFGKIKDCENCNLAKV